MKPCLTLPVETGITSLMSTSGNKKASQQPGGNGTLLDRTDGTGPGAQIQAPHYPKGAEKLEGVQGHDGTVIKMQRRMTDDKRLKR